MKNYNLYELLPTYYRQRDLKEGEPLRAFLQVLEIELAAVENNIAELYDNWFIETCEEWVIPYIAKLLGILDLDKASQLLPILRLQVANTLHNRRRKGTLPALQNTIYESIGWPTQVVPYFEKLSITQTLEDVRLDRGKTINLQQVNQLALLNQPSDPFAHTIDVHLPDNNILSVDYAERLNIGKYNIQNIGIFLGQLRSFPLQFAQARPIQADCYTFNPLGVDSPLFMPPPSYSRTHNSVSNQNLPRPLIPQDLISQFNSPAIAQLLVDDQIFPPSFQVFLLNEDNSFLPEKEFTLQAADLSHWQIPNSSPSSKIVFVDLSLGRLAFSANIKAQKVYVSYAYGFSADIGGGPYSRCQTLSSPNATTWLGWVAQPIISVSSPENDRQFFPSLIQAIQAWSQQEQKGIIRICDNGLYDLEEDATELRKILVKSSNSWSLTIEAADGFRPCLLGNLNLLGRDSGSQLVLNGLWLNGTIFVAGNLRLVIHHCTIRAEEAAINYLSNEEVASPVQGLEVAITHSIVSSISLPEQGTRLNINDSIIDGGNNEAITSNISKADDNWGPPTKMERTTVLGRSKISQIIAANSVIFAEPLLVKNQQEGSISFSYVPLCSSTPPRYRCQPETEVGDREQKTKGKERNENQRGYNSRFANTSDVHSNPMFVSKEYGNPGYAMLSFTTSTEILTGAENGMEIGVFNELANLQRLANLQLALKENFPYGLTEKLVINPRLSLFGN